MGADAVVRDLKLAWRALRKSPGLAAVVVITLGFGIAAVATLMSFVSAYLLRPLPFGEPERLVQLGQVDSARGRDAVRFSLPQYLDYKERVQAFDDLAAYRYTTVNVTGDGEPERITAGVLTANMFDLLAAEPALGRTFAPGEDGPAGTDVVVLGHGLWSRRWGADPQVIGRTLTLDGSPHTVVGVMPRDFNFPYGEVKMWVPMRDDAAAEARERTVNLVVGRLADGWSRERAKAELDGIQRQLAEAHPQADGRYQAISVRPLREALNFIYDILTLSFACLLAAVGFLLLIACVNVASLMLARASDRSREVAVRTALGAGIGAVVRPFVVESLLLSLAGGVLGVALARVTTEAIGAVIPEAIYRVGEVSVDGTVVAVAAGVTLLTPLLFGLAPALAAARVDLARSLAQGGRGGAAGRAALRSRRLLVVAEVALAIVLVTGAGLMLRSFGAIQQVETGFDAASVLTVEVTPPEADYPDSTAVAAYFDEATREAAALPGAEAAAAVAPLPLNHETWTLPFSSPEAAPARLEEWPVALQTRTSPGYFQTLDIALLSGRGFTTEDRADSPAVVVVNGTLARRLWPEGDAVGRSLLVGAPEKPLNVTVVGVVGDVLHSSLDGEIGPQLYRPLTQADSRRRFLVVRVQGDPAALAGDLRQRLAGIDPRLPLTLRPMREVLAENTLQWSIGSAFLGVFGASALLLALLGLYGLISYSVAQRRQEMGIRLALGARGAEIRRLVLAEGLRLTAVGLGLGLLLAALTARAMGALLYGVEPFDPVTFGGVVLVFLAVALAASLLPARRAGRVEPMEVLRAD